MATQYTNMQMESLIMDNMLMANEKVTECISMKTKMSTMEDGRTIADMVKGSSKKEMPERSIELYRKKVRA